MEKKKILYWMTHKEAKDWKMITLKIKILNLFLKFIRLNMNFLENSYYFFYLDLKQFSLPRKPLKEIPGNNLSWRIWGYTKNTH